MTVIDIHRDTLDGTEFDKSILNTLRSSGDAIKRLTVVGGINGAEDIIAEVEQQMENSLQINTMLSSGSISGMVANNGGWFSDDDLDKELADLIDEDSNTTDTWAIPEAPRMISDMQHSTPEIEENYDVRSSLLA
jgi:hypothetical protein